MGGCLARPAGTRRVDVVRPARSEDARGKEDRPSHRVSDRLPLSPLDSALCIRGLVVYWAFGFDRRLDPDAVRASLAATLVKYPALAGRARVRARRGATLSLEVDLDHPNAGVAFEVRDEPATTLEDLRRAGPPSAQNNVTPSSLFRPLHIRCCENEGALCAVRLTRLGGAAAPATVLGVSWRGPGGRTRDARVLRGVRPRGARARRRGAARRRRRGRPLRDPSHDRRSGAGGRGAARARAFPELEGGSPRRAFALARGVRRPGRRGVPAARAGHRAHPRGGREGAHRHLLDATSTNDAPPRGDVDAVPAQLGRRRPPCRQRARSGRQKRADPPPLFPVRRRPTKATHRCALFGNASLRGALRGSRRRPRRARTERTGPGPATSPRRRREKAAAAAVAAGGSRRVAASTRAGGLGAARAAAARSRASRRRRRSPRWLGPSADVDVVAPLPRTAALEIWDCDFSRRAGAARRREAKRFGSVLPASADGGGVAAGLAGATPTCRGGWPRARRAAYRRWCAR